MAKKTKDYENLIEELSNELKKLKKENVKLKSANSNFSEKESLWTVKDLKESQRIAKIGTWHLDIATNEVKWTEELYNMYGFDPTLPVPPYTEHMKLFTPKSWKILSTELAKTSEIGVPYELELETIKKDGSNGWMWVRGEVEKDGNGKTIGLWGAAQDITERKQIELENLESKERFEFAMNATNDGLFDWNLVTNDIYYSPGWKSMLGYEYDELPNDFSIWEKLTDPEGVKRSWKMQQELINKQRDRFEMEFIMKHKDGHLVDILSRANAYFDENGKAIRIVGTHIDITEKKKDQLKLKKSEAQFKAITENIADTIIQSDRKGRISYINHLVPGLSREQVLSSTVFDFVPVEQRPVIEKALNSVFLNGKTISYESLGPGPDGEQRLYSVSVSPIYADKSVIAAVFLARDITEQKQIEKDLQNAKERFRQVTEQSPSVYELYDIDGLQIEVNKAYEELWQFPEGRARTVGSFNVLKSKEVVDTGLIEYIKKAYSGELVILPPYKFDSRGKTEGKGSGRVRWLNTRIYPLKDINNKVTNIVINHEDISEKIYTETENKKLQDQLIQAQKMEAIGTLAGGIAHDFNNILGVIMGYTELTMDDLTEPKAIISNLQRVMNASERAKEMVQQILSFSRKDDQTMRSVNIGKVIKEVIIFLRSSIPTTIEIKVDIEKGLGPIFGNATQINQVLMNLCTNASHAMKDNGGVLKIGLKEIVLDTESSVLLSLEPGIYQQLIVCDNGIGINKENIDRIFEPYFTTKDVNEGTGMGLAVIYGIIKNHRGAINVSSEIGKGSVFNVYFPAMDISKSEKQTDITQQSFMGNNESILFVDDEIVLVELGDIMLKKLGYKVDKRTSSIEALETFKSDPDKYGLIVTDMTMPNMTGVQLASEIHKIRPEVPVILCTGFSNGISKNNYAEKGISALVMKPVVNSELSKVIQDVLNKRQR